MATLGEVADELSRSYNKRKMFLHKGEKGPFYLKLLSNLFDRYGNYFGYKPNELSAFKSALMNVKNNAKKSRPAPEPKVVEEYLPQEGDGLSFTQWQIKIYGLNPDSY